MSNPPLLGLTMRREFHDLTMRELGETIGCSQSQMNKFEKGQVRLDIYRAAKLAERLGCHIEGLL